MPTNAIPAGTCNFPLNMKKAERALLGRLSFKRIQSGEFRGVGDYVRHLLLIGLDSDNPAAALRLREIRNGAMAATLLLLVCVSTVLSWIGKDDGDAMRRARGQRVRVARSVRGSSRFEEEPA